LLVRIKSAALIGIDATEVTVEADAAPGIPKELIVGLPDAVIKESKCRIKSAIKNSGFKYPQKVYTINLAPAELPKEGPFLDVPIALAILQLNKQAYFGTDFLYVGELSLNGDIRPIRGIIAICQMAAKKNFKKIFVPYDNYQEASLINNIEIVPIKNLTQIIRIIEGLEKAPVIKNTPKIRKRFQPDYNEVKGQLSAKRAIEIAASGKHNLLFIGPPGSGKTMLLKRLPSILPDLSLEEAIDTIKLQSISYKSPLNKAISLERPFRTPHHSISYAGLAGGGSNPKPGEISLAHNGILFLDEFPEFSRQALEILRQPLEDKNIIISRANITIEYPANFMLVAAMNPCPCGYYKDQKVECACNPNQIKKYWKKISGPILDRFDLILELPRLTKTELINTSETKNPYTSKNIKERVLNATQIQFKRFKHKIYNSDIPPKTLKDACRLQPKTLELLGSAVERGWLTGRSYNKTLKVARTIADLEASPDILIEHVSEALQYRINK
jgi:magnesium chelatase family protein